MSLTFLAAVSSNLITTISVIKITTKKCNLRDKMSFVSFPAELIQLDRTTAATTSLTRKKKTESQRSKVMFPYDMSCPVWIKN